MTRRILIVEDETSVRRLMQMALESPTVFVETAADGPSGLTLFGDGSAWDLILVDQRMPGMDGLDVLRRMKAINRAVAVVMVTAFGSVELAVDAMKLGAADFVRKPLTPDVLRAAVEAAIRARDTTIARRAIPVRRAHPDFEMLTMNGFRLTHRSFDVSHAGHRFTVFYGGADHGTDVIVTIDPEAVARIERLASRRLDSSSTFWQYKAADLLGAYLWSEGRLPGEGALAVCDVSADDVVTAKGWTETL